MGGLERYRRVLRARHVGGLWATSIVARLPIGINGLAIVLAMRHETRSFAAAGAAVGAYALAFGAGSPFQGRLIDRLGPRRVMPPLIAGHALALGLFVAMLGHAPTGVLVALAGISGLGLPSISSVLRAMWPRLLDPGLVTTAFALDAAIVETVFVLGPLLVAAAVAVASARLALVASIALAMAGTALLVSSAPVRSWQPEARRGRDPFGALRSPGLLTVAIATVPVGFGIGAIEIAMPAFATAHHSPGQAGLLVAVWAAGSGIGALVYGARTWGVSLQVRWLATTALLGGGLLLPLAAPSVPVMLALMVPAGAFIAPTFASGGELLGLLAPPGMTTEAYAWSPTSIVLGASIGSAVAGALAEASGWRAAVLAGGAAALAGAAIGAARRRSLEPVA